MPLSQFYFDSVLVLNFKILFYCCLLTKKQYSITPILYNFTHYIFFNMPTKPLNFLGGSP